MERWIYGAQEMLDLLLGHPGTPLERILLLVLGGLAMLLALSKMGQAAGIPNVGRYDGLIVGAVGLVAILFGMLLARLYLLPRLGATEGHIYLFVAGLSLSTVVVVVLMRIMQRSTVASALASWAVGLFFAMLVILLVGGMFDALFAGKGRIEKTKARTSEIDQFLQDR